MSRKAQICTRCIMSNISDNTITFDDNGYCSYCTAAYNSKNNIYFPNEKGEKKISTLVNRLKQENKDKKFDCIMGISGGLDSAYLAYLGAKKWGLRILGVHIDDGYDTKLAMQNIKNLCVKANIKLIVIKPNSKQFNELTRAFMKAGVPNLASPQDNVLFAHLYKCIKKSGVHQFLSGSNFSLECILQTGNTHSAYDTKNIKDINKRFGRIKINKLPLISELKADIYSKLLRIETLCPLDYLDYNRERAIIELKDYCGFQYYGSKHLESRLTKFIQLYWFTKKFDVDKRTSHLSSMIVSGQLTREEALEIIRQPLYDETEMEKDIEFILKRLDISRNEFEQIMKEPPKQHTDYKTSMYPKFKRTIKKSLIFSKLCVSKG